jgi:hypothetical protein
MTLSMKNYAGKFNPDFRLEDLDHALLAHYGREIMLANHMHDRSLMPLVVMKWGMAAQTTVACDEWMGSNPTYTGVAIGSLPRLPDNTVMALTAPE